MILSPPGAADLARIRENRMTYETLDYRVTDRILTLTLNRPERLNAFTVTICNELPRRRAGVPRETSAAIPVKGIE